MKKKHELLKYAYDNYKKGVRFKTLLEQTTHTSTGVFDLNEDDFNAISDVNTGQYVYEYGRWAEIVSENPERTFIMNSEDGVPLFEGDDYHRAYFNSDWEYKGLVGNPTKSEHNPAYHDTAHNKAFSTKESAEAWIQEQNKPQYTDVKLYDKRSYALVYKDKIEIYEDGIQLNIKPSDLEDMLHALKTL